MWRHCSAARDPWVRIIDCAASAMVGECMGGEGDSVPGFADGWDQELAAEVMPVWFARNYMSGNFVDVESLIGVVDAVLRQDGAHIPSVTVATRAAG